MATTILTKANNGGSIEIRTGDEISLQLPENPTTGYRWHIDLSDGLVAQEISPNAADSHRPGPDPQFGAGGIREFRFLARAPGAGRLVLKHWREFEGESSVTERFTVDARIIDG